MINGNNKIDSLSRPYRDSVGFIVFLSVFTFGEIGQGLSGKVFRYYSLSLFVMVDTTPAAYFLVS